MKKCLIVVDFQNDFVDGSLGFKEAKEIYEPILKKLDDALSSKTDIIFTLDTHYDNYLETNEGKNLPIKHCIKGTKGHDIYGKAKNYLKDSKVFEKVTFGSIEIGNYLEKMNYDEIEIVGLVTNMCVISTAIIAKAALPEASIIVDSNAVRSFNEDLHHKTFEILESMFFKVI